ncbi:hypothetical protein M3G91_16975 [Micromonospora chalcea]|uniref:hypothetical protein n=1 Tax=Micromonospora chalcea TaxID=1874 RepID=UPI0021A2AC76|nr:hypothetical protein [Micromonospora chalcea]MCT2279310.1 hypothetical protein [Micromonospora chalcea]
MAFQFAPYYDSGSGKRIMSEAAYEALVGAYTPDGIIGTPNDQPPLKLSGGQLVVPAGIEGILRSYWWSSGTSDLPVPIDPNPSGSTRHDHVVVQVNRDANPRTLGVVPKKGVPGGGLPALTQAPGTTGQFEISLGRVSVPAGGTVATAAVTRLGWYIGPDGQYLCTRDTRPPHAPGRRIREVDTGRSLESDGDEQWLSVLDDSGWVNLAPAAQWERNTLRIRRMSGIGYLQLDLDRKGPSLAASTTSKLCTIPPAYALGTGQLFAAAVIHHGKVGRISIVPNGDVTLSNHEGIAQGQYLVSSASWPIG